MKSLLPALLLLFLYATLSSQTVTVISDGSYGAVFEVQDDTLFIREISSDSPAEEAGLLIGDRIVSIDGEKVSGIGAYYSDLSTIWRDKAGATKQLLIWRESADTLFLTNVRLEYDGRKSGEQVYVAYFVDTTGTLSVGQIEADIEKYRFKSLIDEGIRIHSINSGRVDSVPDIQSGDMLISLKKGYYSWSKLWFQSFNESDSIIRILRDSSEHSIRLEPGDIQNLGIKSSFNHDLEQGEVWLRVIIEGRLTVEKAILLRIADTYQLFEVYQKKNDNNFRRSVTGTSIPASERRPFFKGSPVVKINIRESALDTLYIKVTQDGGFTYPPMFDYLSYNYVVWFENIERLVLGSMLGMMLLIILYLLILFVFIKEKSYLVYMFFVLSLTFALFHLSGYGDEFVWPNSIGFFQDIEPLFTLFPVLLFIVFGSMFLEVKELTPRMYRIGKFVLLIYVPLSSSFWAIEVIAGSSVFSTIFVALAAIDVLLMLFLLGLGIWALIKRLRQNFRPAWYFLAGLIILILSFLTLLSNQGISGFLASKLGVPEDVSTIFLLSSVYIGAILQFLILSVGLSQKMRDSQIEIQEAQESLIAQLKENEALKDKVNRELEQKVEERTKEITDSINYAKRIQTAVLPPSELLEEILPEHFVLFKPRDIVSGDFYWVRQIKNFTVIVAADCTGHGVPGAFMSMLGMSFLNELVTKSRFDSAGELLNRLRKKVKDTLKQEGKTLEQKDGMDLALAIIDNESLEMQYSGAFNPIFIIRKRAGSEEDEDGDYRIIESEEYRLMEIKGDRQPISIHYSEKDFKTNHFQLREQDSIYLFSDGYPDQMGGPDGKKFMSKKFKKLILEIQEYSMERQKEVLDETIEKWKGDLPQIDDIIVFGIRW